MQMMSATFWSNTLRGVGFEALTGFKDMPGWAWVIYLVPNVKVVVLRNVSPGRSKVLGKLG